MKTRFDLEDEIFSVEQTGKDIEMLFKTYGDRSWPMTEDEVMNALLGIYTLHEMRCYWLDDTYKQVHQLNEYATPEVKARREELMGKILKKKKKKKKEIDIDGRC
jgi:hypothetical protein